MAPSSRASASPRRSSTWVATSSTRSCSAAKACWSEAAWATRSVSPWSPSTRRCAARSRRLRTETTSASSNATSATAPAASAAMPAGSVRSCTAPEDRRRARVRRSADGLPPAAAVAVRRAGPLGLARGGPIGVAVLAARHQPAEDAERAQRDVQDVVGGVDGDDPEHVVAVDQPDDRDQAVDDAERQRHRLGRAATPERGQQQETGQDVHEVVPAVDLEAEEAVALDLGPGVEGRVGDEAEDAGEQQGEAGEQAIPLRGGHALAITAAGGAVCPGGG